MINWRKAMKKLLCAVLCAALFTSATGEDRPAHHGQNGFVNPYMEQTHPSLWSFLRARLFSGDWASYDPKQYQVPVSAPNPVAAEVLSDNAAVTWLGHSNVLIQHRGINVLTDPMLTQRASPVGFAGPKRISPPGLRIAQLPRGEDTRSDGAHFENC